MTGKAFSPHFKRFRPDRRQLALFGIGLLLGALFTPWIITNVAEWLAYPARAPTEQRDFAVKIDVVEKRGELLTSLALSCLVGWAGTIFARSRALWWGAVSVLILYAIATLIILI